MVRSKNRINLPYKVKAMLALLLSFIIFNSSLFANMTQVKKLLSSGNYAAAEKTLQRMYGSSKASNEKADIANWLSYSKYKQQDLKGAQDQVQKAFKLNPHNTLDPNLAKDSSYRNFWQDNRAQFKGSTSSKSNAVAAKNANNASTFKKTTLSAKTPGTKSTKAQHSAKAVSHSSKQATSKPVVTQVAKAVTPQKIPRNAVDRKAQPARPSSSPQRKYVAAVKDPPKTPSPQKTLPKKTILIVNANQPDATISIDGIVVGKAGESLEVEPGIFTVNISKPGYVGVIQRVKIGLGQSLSTAVQLNKVAPPPVARPPKARPVAASKSVNVKKAVAKDKPSAKPPQKNISDTMFESPPKAKPPKKPPPVRSAPARNTIADEFAQDVAQANRPVQPAPQPQPYYGAPVAPYGVQAPMAAPPQPYGYAPMPAPGYAPPYSGYGAAPNPYQQQGYGVQPGYAPPPAAMDSPQLPPAQRSPYIPQQRAEPEVPMNANSVDALYSGNNTKARSKKTQSHSKNSVPTFIKFMPFGLPQWVGQQYFLGTLFTGGQIAALYLSYDASTKETAFIDEVNKTIERRTQEISALSDETQRQTAQEELDRYVGESKKYQNSLKTNSQIMLGVFGGLWVCNIVSAFVYPPQSKSNKRLSADSLEQPGLQASADLNGRIKFSYLFPDHTTPDNSPKVKLGLSLNPFHDYNGKGSHSELLLFNVGYTLR